MEPNATPALAAQERYRAVRQQIEFEDGLIAQRLNWFVAAQSFLFTAYAITLNAPPAPQSMSANVSDQHLLLVHLIPLVALAACVLIYFTIIAGLVAQAHLRHFMKHFAADPVYAELPAIQGALATRVLGMCAPLGMPLVFGGVWIYLFTRGLT